MPIYEYRCRNCDVTFEALVRTGTAATCPHCGSSSLDKLLTAPFVSSGRTGPAGGTDLLRSGGAVWHASLFNGGDVPAGTINHKL